MNDTNFVLDAAAQRFAHIIEQLAKAGAVHA
jgi:hypothetical protein